MFLLMIYLFILIYGTGDTVAHRRQMSLIDPVFWQIVLCVFLCFILMGTNVTYLYLVNSQMKQQRGNLSLLMLSKYRKIDELENQIMNFTSTPAEWSSTPLACPELASILLYQKNIISSLEDILSILERVDEIKGSKIAGFKVERQHIVWVVTTLLLFAYSLFQFLAQPHGLNWSLLSLLIILLPELRIDITLSLGRRRRVESLVVSHCHEIVKLIPSLSLLSPPRVRCPRLNT